MQNAIKTAFAASISLVKILIVLGFIASTLIWLCRSRSELLDFRHKFQIQSANSIFKFVVTIFVLRTKVTAYKSWH